MMNEYKQKMRLMDRYLVVKRLNKEMRAKALKKLQEREAKFALACPQTGLPSSYKQDISEQKVLQAIVSDLKEMKYIKDRLKRRAVWKRITDRIAYYRELNVTIWHIKRMMKMLRR